MKKIIGILLLAALWLLAACQPFASGSPQPATPHQIASAIPAISAIPRPVYIITSPKPTQNTVKATPTTDAIAAWLTNRPRNMESYGFTYDPQALPTLPPAESINFPIWGRTLPLHPLAWVSSFITYPAATPHYDLSFYLDRAGCTVEQSGTIDCQPGSPLVGMGCEYLSVPRGDYTGLPRGLQLLAICSTASDESRTDILYRRGCAFRSDAGYILEMNGQYHLVNTSAQLRSILLPILGPDRALTYVEMMTGLTAVNSFEPSADLLYFQDPVRGTRVAFENGVYSMNLFHYQACFCEPWVYSEVILTVTRDGEISWQSALPWAMTLGFSCAD